MKFIRSAVFLYFIFFLSNVFAQTPLMYNYTTEDGLPGAEAFDVIQDERGYIWIATNNGICKFNGKTFEPYYTKDGLPDNSVIDFYKDYTGKIWILTYKNNLAYLKGDSIIPYEFNDLLKQYDNYSGYCIQSFLVEDKDSYFGLFHDVIIKIDIKGKIDTIKHFTEPGLSVYNMFKEGVLYSQYVKTYNNYRTEIVEHDSVYFIEPFKTKIKSNFKVKYLRVGTGLASAYGKKLIFTDSGRVYEELNFESKITKLKNDKFGNILVGTYNSGFFILSKFGEDYKIKHNYLEGKIITSVFNDKNGGYWISTYNHGLFYIPSIEFMYINKASGLSSDYITNIEYGNNELWYTGINTHFGYIERDTIVSFNLSSINLSSFSDLFYDSLENRMWGTLDGGLNSIFIADKEDYKVFNNFEIRYYENSIGMWQIKTIFKNNDDLYMGASPGLFTATFKNEQLTITGVDTAETVLTAGLCVKDGTLWLGNRDSLFLKKNGRTLAYRSDNPLFKKRVVKLICDPVYGHVVVASKDTGIYILNDHRVWLITEKQGLSSNNVTALDVVGNQIWVGTTAGLDQIIVTDYDKFTCQIQHFNKNNGLISNLINDIEVKDSFVYIATDKGISYFNFRKVKKNLIPPPLYLKSIKINNRDTVYSNHYKLGNIQNNIIVEYDGLNYSAPEELVYRYKIDGLHKDWQETRSEKLEFLLLPPGKYSLTILAVNEDGVVSTDKIQLSFRIKQVFYKSWWFISLNIIVFLLVIGAFFTVIYSVRIKEIKKRNKIENQLIKERQKALGQQMNPHFIFNTLNSIQYYLYKNDSHTSMDYLQKFAKLMRNTLYNSQKDFISIHDEIITLRTYLDLEELRLDHSFDYKILVEKNVDTKSIKIPCFLIQPYVENSIWHGIQHLKDQGMLTISISLNHEYIICRIEDNGIGREQSMKINRRSKIDHKSLGSKITENRIELINRLNKKKLKAEYIDKFDNSGNACGTVVNLQIPVS